MGVRLEKEFEISLKVLSLHRKEEKFVRDHWELRSPSRRSLQYFTFYRHEVQLDGLQNICLACERYRQEWHLSCRGRHAYNVSMIER